MSYAFTDIKSIDDPESLSSSVSIFLTSDVLITVCEKPLIDEVLENYESEILLKQD